VGQELKFNDIRFNVTGFLNKIGSNQLETERIRDYGSRKHKEHNIWVEAGFIFDKKIGNNILCNAIMLIQFLK
jgi:hypothetical protein